VHPLEWSHRILRRQGEGAGQEGVFNAGGEGLDAWQGAPEQAAGSAGGREAGRLLRWAQPAQKPARASVSRVLACRSALAACQELTGERPAPGVCESQRKIASEAPRHSLVHFEVPTFAKSTCMAWYLVISSSFGILREFDELLPFRKEADALDDPQTPSAGSGAHPWRGNACGAAREQQEEGSGDGRGGEGGLGPPWPSDGEPSFCVQQPLWLPYPLRCLFRMQHDLLSSRGPCHTPTGPPANGPTSCRCRTAPLLGRLLGRLSQWKAAGQSRRPKKGLGEGLVTETNSLGPSSPVSLNSPVPR
jgi:hypothetical protein